MKKILFLAAVLFWGCKADWNDSVITNASTEEVTFKFSNTGEITLPPGESGTFETKAYQRLERYTPDKRVEFTFKADNSDYLGIFTTRKHWNVTITNTLTEAVILSADGWMENEETEIASGSDTRVIYTEEPEFSAETGSGLPCVVTWGKDSNGDFQVRIR
ncbi:MAG: hypothetical protein LBG90_04500 [Spirochaetaceae bacterium]|jgi:hypothetical protein|nr:hypothetical protein [Spirochaetaceae bacterium]